jgi:hypothetical protein
MASILGSLLVELGINTAAFKAGTDKATYLGKQLSNDLKKSFSELGDSMSQLGASLGGALGPLGGVIASTVKGFETMRASVEAASKGAPEMLALAGALGGIGLVATGAAIGIGELAKGGADVIEQLNLMSEKTGISVRNLQTLKAMGDSVNVPLEQLAMGFRRFSKALAEGGDGTKETSRMLRQLGITAHEPFAAFQQLAEGISKIADPNERAARAAALLGNRVAQGLLPDLEKGSAGVEKYSRMIDMYGASIGPEQIARQEKYKDSQTALSLSWDRLRQSASWALPYMKKLNEIMAEGVAHPFGIGFGDVPKVSPEEAAKEAAKQKSLDTSFQQAAAELKVYQQIKAQTAAAYELENVQEQIKDALELHTAAGNKEAAQLQAQIPLLERKAQLSKEAAEALRSLPETTRKAIEGEDVKVTQAYASAIKALGPAYEDEARQLEVTATVQKFVNEQKDKGIAGDARAIAAAAQYKASVEAVTLATAELGKATDAGKIIQEFAEHTKEATKNADELAGKHGELAKIEAELRDGLDKSMRALVEETAAYNAHKAAIDANAAATDDERAQLEAEGKLLGQHVTAVNADSQAIDELITKKQAAALADANDSLTQRIADIRLETELLGSNSEAEAKNIMALEHTAEKLFGVGAAAKAARDAYVAMHASETTDQTKAGKTQTATQTGQGDATGSANQLAALMRVGQQLQINKEAWAALASAELQDAGVSKFSADVIAAHELAKAIDEIRLKELELKAAGGSTTAALSAGMLQFALETKTAGQALSQNLTTAMNATNAAIAKTIVTGKNFGKEMKDVAQQFMEGMIEAFLKIAERYVIMKITQGAADKGFAAAQAAQEAITTGIVKTASAMRAGAAQFANVIEAVPYPANLVTAPIAATAAMVQTAMYEKGGIVPETGPALLHAKEMVLPSNIAQKVTNMADGHGGARSGTTVNVNHTSHTQALDGRGVGQILNAHSEEIANAVMKSLRRRNMI